MNKISDGGPAFPVWELNGHGQQEMTGFGLSVRDYFAAKALPAVLAQKDVHGHIREWENAAWISYQIADAMLRKREASND